MIGEPETGYGRCRVAAGRLRRRRPGRPAGLKSALVRAIQVCAALDGALALSIEHAASRVQFGRPLAKFQAVQHLISGIAAEAALARSATEAALSVAVDSDWSSPGLEFLVAAARSCAGHATSVVVRDAHQVLGAIGTTSEHPLHVFTRAALAWRSEFGSVRYWDTRSPTWPPGPAHTGCGA